MKAGYIEVQCSKCGQPREMTKDSYREIMKGRRRNVCPRCSQKEAHEASRARYAAMRVARKLRNQERVDVTCAACGNVRSILVKTLKTYAIKGKTHKCPSCGTAPNGVRGYRPSGSDPKTPVIPMGRGWRCEGFFTDECGGKYSSCLDAASRRSFAGFSCRIRGGRKVEIGPLDVSGSNLLEAYMHSVETGGWLPDQMVTLSLR